MANDLKSGIGYLIPAAGFIGFVTSLVLEMYLLSIILAVASILAWFLYMLVMESGMPSLMGNMILLFGILLSVGIFMGFGVKPNMWGGIEFQTEGSIFALVILFFSVLMGLSYRNLSHGQATSTIGSGLSGSDRDLVLDAIKQGKEESEPSTKPKVIVVKQELEQPKKEEKEEKEEKQDDPYNMMNNPYFAYPPEYYYDYYDEEDEDEDDEDDEDEDWDEEDD